MKKIVAIAILGLLLSNVAVGEEKILSYKIEIYIEKNSEVIVKERIRVFAEGNQISRGIYRSFPTRYKDRMGNNYSVRFDVLEVLKNGVSENYFTENVSNGKILYIGNQDIYLDPGEYEYEITFKTDRQLGYFEDFDELYFNAIGGDWAFTIEEAEVTVYTPERAEVVQYSGYLGEAGSTACSCEIRDEGDQVTFKATRPLYPGEQFTVAVAWPKGVVAEPTGAEKAEGFVEDNINVIVGLLGLLITFTFYFLSWKKVGVDPLKGTIIPRFEPPTEFNPASVSYVMKMGFKSSAFTASLVNMAVNKHIKIVETSKGKYTLEKISNDYTDLSEGERKISEALFTNSDIIELKQKNYQRMMSAQSNLRKFLSGNFKKPYFATNTKYLVSGILMSIFFIVLMFILTTGTGILLAIFIVIAFIALAIVFGYLLKAPTRRGREIMDEIEGFKMYLSVAEKNRMEFNAPAITRESFERLLPYAIALNVATDWAKKFENAIKGAGEPEYSPLWYHGHSYHAFRPSSFTSSLNKSFSSAISSSSSPPGGSSGSGGGGSSGGGGGGGGGGGW